jgi:hypothetical protein
MKPPGPFERLGAFLDTHASEALEQLQRAFRSSGASPTPQMTPERARDIARGLRGLAERYADAQMPHEAEKARRDAEQWEARAANLEVGSPP